MLKRKTAKTDRKKRDRTDKHGAPAAGIRGLSSGIVGTLFANQVRASAGKAGVAGVAAGVAFNMLLKRTPVGAMLFGGAMLAHQAYKSGKTAQAKRDAKKALEKGALAPPPESATPERHPAAA